MVTTTIDHKAVYDPLGWQVQPWRDKSTVLLLTGAAGGGKSRLAAEKIHGYLKRYSGATGIALRKAREYASKSVVPFLRSTVIGSDDTVKYNKSDYTFQYNNGSVLYIGGMGDRKQREAIRSMGGDGSFDIAWMEEANAFSETDYQEVLARMRGKAASWRQIILTTNPDSPYHWIKRRLIDKGEASVYYSNALDNPYNPDDYYTDILGALVGHQRERLREGKWILPEGVVYGDWNEKVHVIPPFKIPDDWRRYLAIDFGYTNPFVCNWVAVDGDGRMYIYREIYMTKRLLHSPDGDDHVSQIKTLTGDERIEAAICDSADPDAIETLRRFGINAIGGDKNISLGIQAVEGRLKVQGDGKPRLYYVDNALVEEDTKINEGKAKSTKQEFSLYIWPEGTDGKPMKEVPVDDNNHGLDGIRYLSMYLDKPDTKLKVQDNPFY